MEDSLKRFMNWIDGDVKEVYRMVAGNSPGNVDFELAKIAIEIRHHREMVKTQRKIVEQLKEVVKIAKNKGFEGG